MKPILPAFSGYVPHAILVCFFVLSFHEKYYPNVTHSISPLWAGFNSTYSNIVLIEPSDPLFKEISIRFIRKQIYPFFSSFLSFPLFLMSYMELFLIYIMVIYSWKCFLNHGNLNT